MIANQNPALDPPPAFPVSRPRRSDFSPLRRADVLSVTTAFFSSSSKLFVAPQKLKSFVFNKIQTLCAKHRGWGYPPNSTQRNQQHTDSRPASRPSRAPKTSIRARLLNCLLLLGLSFLACTSAKAQQVPEIPF